ncbi:MAG: hypothetical protein F4Y67_00990 [Chloroflexi bacterium]|nr:hypothetical protein [Chloroflexota bacterium]
MEDIAGRFSLIGFYVSPRELIWLTGAVAAEALLAGVAVTAGFSLPTLLLLAVPALACWAALRLRVDGAVFERWFIDMALFIARGRVLAVGRQLPDFGAVQLRIRLDYEIDSPVHSLRRGHRSNRGFRFEAID